MRRSEGSLESYLEVRSTGGRAGVFAVARIPAGTLVLRLKGPSQDHPSRYTIQIDGATHLNERGLVDGEINHSCAPNAFVDLSDASQPVIRALDSIPAGAEVTIDYCASEDEVVEPFQCVCGAEDCYGIVRGYSHLSNGQRRALGRQVSPYLLKKHGDPA